MECDFDQLLEMFALMGRNGLDTTESLKWQFFFMDSAVEPQRCVLKELEGHNYQLERLEPADDGTWVLAVSNCEALASHKLHRRNQAFNELAEYCGAELYDGWDVGPIEARNHPISQLNERLIRARVRVELSPGGCCRRV